MSRASVKQKCIQSLPEGSQSQARFPFKRNRLRCCVACRVNENRKKRKRLRWQAANHGCHCFNRAFLLAGACVCCVTQRMQRKRLRLNGNRASRIYLLTAGHVEGYSKRRTINRETAVSVICPREWHNELTSVRRSQMMTATTRQRRYAVG